MEVATLMDLAGEQCYDSLGSGTKTNVDLETEIRL